MEGNPEPAPGDLRCGVADGGSPQPEPSGAGNDGEKPEGGFGKGGRLDREVSLFAPANGARYKSMSPARLPITRAPCLTIPPGFSPSALLESPVLLTNTKAEPSPTTGTCNISCIMHKAVALSPPRDASAADSDYEGSSDFEFKPHVGSSPLKPLGSVELIQKDQEPSMHIQCQSQDRNKVTSKDDVTLLVSGPGLVTEASDSRATIPPEATSDGFHQNMQMFQYDDSSEPTNSSTLEKSAEDGYNWRKYGQKHVKGSEYPRSYYKCTHPNFKMNKLIERSYQGQITGIIYKGRHDHPKPQPNSRLAVGLMLTNQEEEKTDYFPSSMIVEDETTAAPGQICNQIEPNDNTELSPASISENDVESGGGHSNNCDEVAGDGDQEAKRRKMEATMNDAASVGKINRQPRVVVQTVSEVDILDDGYRWRKYGQKVVKGNPNPRSYYKCTTAGCPVRKHVERASHDPKAVITTYEGKHNHDVPAAKSSSHEASSSMVADGDTSLTTHSSAAQGGITGPFPHPFTQTETHTISLALGVGISPKYEKQRSTETNQSQHHHFQSMDCGEVVIQATPPSNFYASSHAGMYEHAEGRSEGFTFKAAPTDISSNMYYTTTGNLVYGSMTMRTA